MGAEPLLANVVTVLTFFPFFRYLPLGPVETQPVGAILALVGLFAFGMSSRPPARMFLALATLMLVLSAISIVGMGIPVGKVLSQLAAYVAPIATMLFLWGRIGLISTRVVLASGLAYLLFGLGQYLGLVPNLMEQLLTSIQPRYQTDLVGGGRGVVMFAPEPSYAAKQLLLFIAFLIAFWRDGRLPGRNVTLLLLITLVAMIVLNKSVIGIGVSVAMILVFITFLLRPLSKILLIIASAILLYFSYTTIQRVDASSVTQASPRIVQVAFAFSQEIARGNFGLSDLILFGSARIITNIAGARALPDADPLGVGIGNADVRTHFALENDEILRDIQFDPTVFLTLKPQSWIICFFLEAGWLGAILFSGAFVAIIRSARGENRPARAASAALITAALVQLLLLGPHSLPVPWLMLLLSADNTTLLPAKPGHASEAAQR
ncbi:MAG: hypothetical protein SNJ79_08145 [Sphingomonadaceae bacterium]